MGFIPDIEEICSKLPKSRQTLLFSATMPPPIQKLAAKFLNDPKRVEVARPATANINIEQRLIEVSPDKKKDVLRDILRHEEFKNAIIFCNRKTTVRELTSSLKRSGFKVGQIQGDMDQSDRIAEFDRFKKDEINILVASDVAARGLDVKGVSHVINFDVPWQPDDYIHRIGRTGRAGMTGIAITLATRQDAEAVAGIEKLTGLRIARTGQSTEPRGAPDRAEPRDAAPKQEKTSPKREPAKAPPTERAKEPKRERAQEPKREPAREPKREPAREPKHDPIPEAKAERSPVVEDIKSEWNGPLPSFLSKSAG
jgi:superfamily II DNA/RNA helicase